MRVSTILSLAVCSLVVSGCASDGLYRMGGAHGRLVVANQSAAPLGSVQLARCDAAPSDRNRLQTNTSVPPGGEYTFTVDAGCWLATANGRESGRLVVAAGETVRHDVR